MAIPNMPSRPALDRSQLEKYRSFRIAQIRPFERLAAVASAVTVVVFIVWDAIMFDAPLSRTLPLRLGLAAVLLGLLALTFTKLSRYHRLIQLVSTAILLGGFSWVLLRLPDGFTVGLAGLALSVGMLPLLATELRSMITLCAIGLAVPNVFLLVSDASGATVFNVNVWMALAAALAISFWAVFDIVNRQLFITEQSLARERDRADRLLANMLPVDVADQLKASSTTVARRYESVTVLFADIVGFTAFARAHEPDVVVALLNRLFTRFDDLVTLHGVEKIKTIGDGYMAAGGVPTPRPDHAAAVADLALAMVEETSHFSRDEGVTWEVRIGLHSGPVVAGVIGTRRFAFDLWGDAVNIASRLESTSVAGRIQLSGSTARMLGPGYRVEARGTVTLRNRGEANTFFLLGKDDATLTTPVPAQADHPA